MPNQTSKWCDAFMFWLRGDSSVMVIFVNLRDLYQNARKNPAVPTMIHPGFPQHGICMNMSLSLSYTSIISVLDMEYIDISWHIILHHFFLVTWNKPWTSVDTSDSFCQATLQVNHQYRWQLPNVDLLFRIDFSLLPIQRSTMENHHFLAG